MRTINYSVSYEKLISRLPALFAFIETDEQGVTTIVKATEGKQGNYGKIVADLVCPSFDYTLANGDIIKITTGSHSYRNIIDAYYQAINDMKQQLTEQWPQIIEDANKARIPYPNFNQELNKMKYKFKFIAFVEIGIGLKYVGLSEETEDVCGGDLKNKKIYPLAPDYLYLGEVRGLYDKVIKIEKQIEFWENHTKTCKSDLKYYEALKQKYSMMHGYDLNDENKRPLKETLEKLIEEAERVAEEYKEYATEAPKLNFSVNLTTTIKDLGLVTPYIQAWVPGKRYYHGDVVYNIDQYGYGLTWECNIKDITPDREDTEDDKKTYVYEDEYGRKYINGQYDEDTEMIYFENGSQMVETNKYWLPQSLNWIEEGMVGDEHPLWKYNDNYIVNESFEDNGKVYKEDDVIENMVYTTLNITNQAKCERYPRKGEGIIKVTGMANSHLTSLRRFNTYMNRNEQAESPDNYRDWLWFYRVGTIINMEAKYDTMGNLAVMYGEEEGDNIYPNGVKAIIGKGEGIDDNDGSDTVYNLAIWGDIIESIVAENNNETNSGIITFTYWLGAHLLADKDALISVITPFTENKKIYNYNDNLTLEQYVSLSETNKNYVEIKTKKDLYIEEKFNKNDEIDRQVYESLLDVYKQNIKIIVIKEFKLPIEHFVKGQDIGMFNFDSLTEDKKQYIDLIVKKEFTLEGKKYEIGDTLPKSKYEFLANPQEYLFFQANETFDVEITYKEGSELSIYRYEQVREKFSDYFKFYVYKEFINKGKYYSEKQTLLLTEFNSLSSQYHNDSYFEFEIKRDFKDNKINYRKGQKIDFATFEKITPLHQENITIRVKKEFNIGGQMFKEGEIIKKEDYDGLLRKEDWMFDFRVTNANGITETKSYVEDDRLTESEYNELSADNKNNCKKIEEWYSIDNDGNYKYYFKNLRVDNESKYGKNQGVKYTESYIYYQGNAQMEALMDFIDGPKIHIGDMIYANQVQKEYKTPEYLSGYDGDYIEEQNEKGEWIRIYKEYKVIKPFINGPKIQKGDILDFDVFNKLCKLTYEVNEDITDEMYNQLIEKNKEFCSGGKVTEVFIDDNKIKCRAIEETIWTLVERGDYGDGKTYFEKYVNGEFDKGFKPKDIDDEDTNAPYYFKLYDKMEFNTDKNLYIYDIRVANGIKKVPYIRTNYETNVDIRHIDVEKTPLIRYDYYNGVSFQPSVNQDVNIERGVTQAFEKHIKFSEVKTFEDLENYANGGFFIMSKENIDLG